MKQICSKEMAEWNRGYKETEHIYAHYAASHGVSATTLCMLYALYTADIPCTQSQLVADWGIPMQTVNSCLKNLEKSGMVCMEYREGNRKNKYIGLTAEGERLCDQIVAPMVQAENAAFAALTQEEQTLLLQISRKYNSLLRTSMENAGKEP